ncbi:MAG: insulinase family protein [Firmicutes bacterium]|nr:insulinase family protein [Alicyclobacillaceae bacterium]MCL6497171.1 insulinase family protein [Bacillota bacterium]
MRYEAPLLQEVLVQQTLESGLVVTVIPRPGFKKAYATFTTHYGSIDNHFQPPGEEPVTVPDGIAHFLEHKMFEKPEGGDVFDDFAALGASANAYTDYTTTTYLFATTQHFYEALTILLDFVQRPYFTPENVEKEKGIIEQEIRMYLDMPQDRLHSHLMRALYQRHPARIDIAGTVESIRTITPEALYRCYGTFYHPSNMMLLVIGDVDPEAVVEAVRANQAAKGYVRQGAIARWFPEEPEAVAAPRVEHRMAVARPLLLVGYKDRPDRPGWPPLTREVAAGLALGMLVGPSSALYERLYREGLINDRFAARYSHEATFAFAALGGETPDPDRLEAILVEELPRAPLTAADLERIKRKELGGYVALFQNPEELAYWVNHLYFRGIDCFRYPDVLQAVTLEQVEAVRRELLDPAHCAVSVIRPLA